MADERDWRQRHAELHAAMEEMRRTWEAVERRIMHYHCECMLAQALGVERPPVPPDLEGWVT